MKARLEIGKLNTAMSMALFLSTLLVFGQSTESGGLRSRIQERMAERSSQKTGRTRDNSQHYKIAGLDVAVWAPSQEGAVPMIIFSHGFHGSNTQSKFLMDALAEAGYLMIAPNHEDKGFRSGRPEEDFKQASNWTDQTYRDRHDDIARLLEALHSDPQWSGRIDWSRVGMSGHSLGGYTALGVGGAWPSWKIPEIKAVLALSPYVNPYVVNGGNLGGLGIPVMYQTGTKDFGIKPFIAKKGEAYDKTSSPEYYVEFEGAGHLAWCDLRNVDHDLITHYSVAFFDKYLKGDSNANPAAKLAGVSDLRAK